VNNVMHINKLRNTTVPVATVSRVSMPVVSVSKNSIEYANASSLSPDGKTSIWMVLFFIAVGTAVLTCCIWACISIRQGRSTGSPQQRSIHMLDLNPHEDRLSRALAEAAALHETHKSASHLDCELPAGVPTMQNFAENNNDMEALQAMRDASNAASRDLLKGHLSHHLSQNPDSSFVSWIAALHPENVTLDHRMTIAGNDWLEVWNSGLADSSLATDADPAHEPSPTAPAQHVVGIAMHEVSEGDVAVELCNLAGAFEETAEPGSPAGASLALEVCEAARLPQTDQLLHPASHIVEIDFPWSQEQLVFDAANQCIEKGIQMLESPVGYGPSATFEDDEEGSAVSPVCQYEEAVLLNRLSEMGFEDVSTNKAVLEETNGDFNEAIQELTRLENLHFAETFRFENK